MVHLARKMTRQFALRSSSFAFGHRCCFAETEMHLGQVGLKYSSMPFDQLQMRGYHSVHLENCHRWDYASARGGLGPMVHVLKAAMLRKTCQVHYLHSGGEQNGQASRKIITNQEIELFQPRMVPPYSEHIILMHLLNRRVIAKITTRLLLYLGSVLAA